MKLIQNTKYSLKAKIKIINCPNLECMCVQILNACVCVCLKVLIISTISLHVRKNHLYNWGGLLKNSGL